MLAKNPLILLFIVNDVFIFHFRAFLSKVFDPVTYINTPIQISLFLNVYLSKSLVAHRFGRAEFRICVIVFFSQARLKKS